MATVEGKRAASRVEDTMKRYRPEAVPHKGRAAQGYEALRTWADETLPSFEPYSKRGTKS